MISEQFALVDAIEQMCAGKKVGFQPIRTAGDIMNQNVKTLTLDHTVKAFVNFMNAHKVRHAPVVDYPDEEKKKPCFIGVVSERDVLRLKPKRITDGDDEDINSKAVRQLLQQIVARNPWFASPDTTVLDVIRMMIDNHIDMIPVLSDDKLVGIITTTDILKVFTKLDNAIVSLYPDLYNQAEPFGAGPSVFDAESVLFSWVFQSAGDIMTREVVCLEPTNTLADAIEVMKKGKFRHAPVLDESAKLAGIISDRDILRQLPFGGRRPPSQSTKFRDHLFKVDDETPQLLLGVTEFMTREITGVSANCRICEAAKTLRSMKVSCLPVVDQQQKLLGIVTIADLMRALLPTYQPIQQW
ncbi:MAG: CBS domain-containing protein [Planctomycetota bacterium]|jgi:acetoin utilization protein AcuB